MKKLFSVLLVALLFTTISNYSFANYHLSSTGLTYTTLQAVFDAANSAAGGVGAKVITVTSDKLLAAADSLIYDKVSPKWTSLRIIPAGIRTITCAENGPIITLINCRNVEINGLNDGVNSLRFNSTAPLPGNLKGSINLSNGSSKNIIRNIYCFSNDINGRMINIAQTLENNKGNDSNIVERCITDGGARGLQVFGTNTLPIPPNVFAYNTGNIFRNNRVLNAAALAIFIGSATRGNIVDSNEVTIPGAPAVALAVAYRGINVQAVGNNSITRNMVHNLKLPGGFAHSYIGILLLPVVPVVPNSVPTNIDLINNCVTLQDNNANAPFIYGIGALSTAAPNDNPYTANIYHNTSRVGGIQAGVGFTAALIIAATTQGSVMNSFNNIASNERAGGAAGTFHIGYDLTTYDTTSVTLNSDYNLATALSVSPPGWDAGYHGFVYSGGFLSTYKDSTCADGVEQHTSNDFIKFIGPKSCVIDSACGNMNGKTPLVPPVPRDIFGNLRSISDPWKGCWEGPALRVLSVTGCLEGKVADGEVRVDLFSGCDYQCSGFADLSSGTSKAEFTFANGVGAGPFRLRIVSINHLETWSLGTVTFAGGTATYNFPTQGAFGGNLAASGCFYAGDRNQDSIVDLTDLIGVFNDAVAFSVGCRLSSDMNSDGSITLTDVLLTYGNAINFVQVASPCPAGPTSINSSNNEFLRSQEPYRSRIRPESSKSIDF